MTCLLDLPSELLGAIIEHLVILVGIQNSVTTRTVCRAFDLAILHAICVSQVVDIEDPATPGLASRIEAKLRGKIFLHKSRLSCGDARAYLRVVSDVNRRLDDLVNDVDSARRKARHEAVARAVEMIEDGPTSNTIESQNLLSGAIAAGETQVTLGLLEGGTSIQYKACVNRSTPYFQSPLHLAAIAGSLDTVKVLLEYRVHGKHTLVETVEQDELTIEHQLSGIPPSPLRLAISYGHTEIFWLLVRPEYRPAVTSKEYSICMREAAKTGRIDLIDALCKVIGRHWTEIHGLGGELMMTAARHNRKEVVSMLLEHGISPNLSPPACRSSVLHLAASLGHTAVVELLMDEGASVTFNPNELVQDCLPIEGAAEGGHTELVKILLDRGADPAPALRSAAQGGNSFLLAYLLQRFPELPGMGGGDVGQQAMFKALVTGNLAIVTRLVEAGVQLDDGTAAVQDGWDDLDYGLPQCSMEMVAKEFPLYLVQHLIMLGARSVDTAGCKEVYEYPIRGILISERTWQWVGKS